MKISWNTCVNAPCIGEIVAEDGRTLLIQADFDYPGVASTFGWEITSVRPANGDSEDTPDCTHSRTDGTVNCPRCGATAGKFIESAGEWLRDNDGATTDDPGYFG